jgi:hypothetical protein
MTGASATAAREECRLGCEDADFSAAPGHARKAQSAGPSVLLVHALTCLNCSLQKLCELWTHPLAHVTLNDTKPCTLSHYIGGQLQYLEARLQSVG